MLNYQRVSILTILPQLSYSLFHAGFWQVSWPSRVLPDANHSLLARTDLTPFHQPRLLSQTLNTWLQVRAMAQHQDRNQFPQRFQLANLSEPSLTMLLLREKKHLQSRLYHLIPLLLSRWTSRFERGHFEPLRMEHRAGASWMTGARILEAWNALKRIETRIFVDFAFDTLYIHICECRWSQCIIHGLIYRGCQQLCS
jgi:hypothetical protein